MAAGPEINTSHLNILISAFGIAYPESPLTSTRFRRYLKLT
jgi:hypothetical protein